jgi:hypothetical protein
MKLLPLPISIDAGSPRPHAQSLFPDLMRRQLKISPPLPIRIEAGIPAPAGAFFSRFNAKQSLKKLLPLPDKHRSGQSGSRGESS